MLAASLALSGDEANARVVAQELLAIEPSFRVSTFVSWYPLQRADDLARLGACPSNSGFCWPRKRESDSLPPHEQDIPRLEDR